MIIRGFLVANIAFRRADNVTYLEYEKHLMPCTVASCGNATGK